jgi:hypothetical protein
MRKLSASLVTALLMSGTVAAVAAGDADKVALQKSTADCKAQVKEYAQYHETSWYQRHKMRKKCISDALEKK